jgi:uncharacterized protein
MNAKFKRRIKRVFITLALIYLLGGIVLYFIQDKIVFHPTPLRKDHRFSFDQAFEEINVPFEKENLSIIKFKPADSSKGIVLFYHGNMENAEHYKNYPVFFLRNHYEVWMIDYPGFGKASGKPTERLINDEALFMYDLASRQTSSDSIIVYGKSIGTGVAAYVAANRNCKRLILETPYYSLSSLARHYFPIYPVDLLIHYAFPVHDYLIKVNAPVTILHGTRDEVVPYKQSIWLKKEQPKIELITIENGKHNNLSAFVVFQRKIDSLLSD